MSEASSVSPHAGPPARIRVAQGLALLALACSLVGALGPAERVRTTYSWPPASLPAETPERAWYTPLLLVAHRPDAIEATVPCALAPALPEAETPTIVLATARSPERVGGLAVTLERGRLEVSLGDRVLDWVDMRAGLDGDECAYRLRASDAGWTLEAGTEVLGTGELDARPVVTGLFSELDLRAPGAPSIDVTTAVHATRTTTRQAVAWIVGALAAVAALLLVAVPDRPRPWATASRLARGAWSHARAPDAVVAGVLTLWWVISPAYFDDGWVAARERAFEASRGFPHYYSTFGVNQPLDYWIEWLHHWLAQSTPALLWNRLPAVLCLAAIWVLCRWIAHRILSPVTGSAGIPLWTLASVFVVGAVAWGITLRPEPVTALLVTGVLACMVLFLERESTAAVAVAAALVALALSAHPAGIVSLAAIVVAFPRLLRWVRPNVAAATAIVAAAVSLLALLLFVGSDLEQRRDDAQIVRTYAFDEGWRDELTRYSLLVQHHYGTPLRRTSVALIGLAVFAYLLRRRRGPFTLLDLPAAALTVGLVLFVAIPSKWPSHFGTLAGLAAVAFCCEAARIRGESSRSAGWSLWPFAVLGAASGLVAWAWLERQEWNVADLRTLDWTPGFESWLPVAVLSALVPLLALGAVLLAARARKSPPPHAAPWRAASWSGVLVAVPVLAFTTAMIVVDTAKTASWTLARQNLASLAGRDPGCGLGDDLLVPVRESATSLPLAGASTAPATPGWVPPAPVAGVPRYALGPTTSRAASTPWFELTNDRRIGVFVSGIPGMTDRFRIEWGRRREGGFLELDGRSYNLAPDRLSGDAAWRFLTTADLGGPPAGATAVRFTLLVGATPGGSVAVAGPVTYSSVALANGLTRAGARTLVLPNLLMYLPCARLPTFASGVVEPPDRVVAWRLQRGPLSYHTTSPFAGISDLYDLEQLSIADSDDPPADVLVYDVDRRLPGMVMAPPTATTLTS